MNYRDIIYHDLAVKGHMSEFEPDSGVNEYNIILEGSDTTLSFEAQHTNIQQALKRLTAMLPEGTAPVMMRYFVSDPANQASHISQDAGCAVSVIGQPPAGGAKVAVWAYLQTDMSTGMMGALHASKHGAYTHLWVAGETSEAKTPESMTEKLLSSYAKQIADAGGSLGDNCQRTWFFVHDVDVNYSGVVNGRNNVFAVNGLTRSTHFIASTGISGYNADPHATVTMDAYAVLGLSPAQITYLKASDYLNCTADYGVAFERGTAICYGDRRHALISGTASINNRGEVMYPGDIRQQADRMLQNIEALVAEGECQMSDLTHMIIYLRDIADYTVVRGIFESRYVHVPKVIVWAPVCRPGWLIEVECMAINDKGDASFAPL